MSILNSNLRVEAKTFFPSLIANPKGTAMNQFCQWGFKAKDQKLVDKVLSEWFAAGTLENILSHWENITSKEVTKEQVPLNILLQRSRMGFKKLRSN